MQKTPLERALAKFDGNQSKFAAAVGTSQQLVSYWVRKKRPIPAEHVASIADVTGIKPHELRPDIFPKPEQARAA